MPACHVRKRGWWWVCSLQQKHQQQGKSCPDESRWLVVLLQAAVLLRAVPLCCCAMLLQAAGCAAMFLRLCCCATGCALLQAGCAAAGCCCLLSVAPGCWSTALAAWLGLAYISAVFAANSGLTVSAGPLLSSWPSSLRRHQTLAGVPTTTKLCSTARKTLHYRLHLGVPCCTWV